MKKIISLVAIFLLSVSSVFAQKTALDYLNNIPFNPNENPCAYTSETYHAIDKKLKNYSKQLSEDIYRRTQLAVKLNFRENMKRWDVLFDTVTKLNENIVVRFYKLKEPASSAEMELSKRLIETYRQIGVTAAQPAAIKATANTAADSLCNL